MKYLFNIHNVVSVIFKNLTTSMTYSLARVMKSDWQAERELKKVEFELRPKD